jgi:dynein light chain LC8-type
MSGDPLMFSHMWGARVQTVEGCNPDIPDDLLKDAIEFTKEAITVFKTQDEAAEGAVTPGGEGTQIVKAIKSKLDEKYGPSWHVIQGKNFGSYVTHESHRFIYFYLDDEDAYGGNATMIFKAG